MSAYLCNPQHTGILAGRLAAKTSNFGDAATIAEALATENLNSVACRYNMTVEKTAQEFMGSGAQAYIQACKSEAMIVAHSYLDISPARLIGMCGSQEYQSCEHDGWAHSEAREMVAYLYKSAVSKHMELTGVTTGWDWNGN